MLQELDDARWRIRREHSARGRLDQIVNDHAKIGIGFGHRDHPIKALEKLEETEQLRGVAAGRTVRIIGQVILAIVFKGLSGEKKTILARFKITELGGTDWVPIIFGARAIDCVERNGLGFMPGPHSHFLTALGLQIERVEEPEYEWACLLYTSPSPRD